ncbi:epoxide hydrolase [Polaromonas sp.]|nr:epoxide hydrolase [Candidatus Saccharibacteria bacterium]
MKKFTVKIDQSALDDLNERLNRTRWPDEPAHMDWNMGTSTSYLKELVAYWKNHYDWRKHEAEINKFPQFMTSIDGHNIHFIHVKGKNKSAKPLLLLHGWPDSFYRFHKIISLLTEPEKHGGNADSAYDVVIPSFPGYGFSSHDTVSSSKAAELIVELMTKELGYDAYMVAGGDMGTRIAKAMAIAHPEAMLALHLTDADYPTGQENPETMTKNEQEFAKYIQGWWMMNGIYAMMHSTKPQTLAPALNDSPVGLASWMISFIDIGAKDHDVEGAVGGRDELLTLIMINWLTQNSGPAIRMYALDAFEKYQKPGGPSPEPKSKVPAALAIFPREAPTPEDWGKRSLNLQSFTKMEKGGHFAALELPEEYTKELRKFFADY